MKERHSPPGSISLKAGSKSSVWVWLLVFIRIAPFTIFVCDFLLFKFDMPMGLPSSFSLSPAYPYDSNLE